MTLPTESILALEVPVIVRLAERKLSLSEIMNLIPGAILELNKRSEDELDLFINNRQIGTGVAVKVGENFGLSIAHIGSIEERIHAMGNRPAPTDQDTHATVDDDQAEALAAAMLAGQG